MRRPRERLAAVALAALASAGCAGDSGDCGGGVPSLVVAHGGRYAAVTDASVTVDVAALSANDRLVIDRDAGVVTRTRIVDGSTVVERYRVSAVRHAH